MPLTDLTNLADALAGLLLADRAPRDWTTCPRADEIRMMADYLRDRGYALPVSVVEVLARSERRPCWRRSDRDVLRPAALPCRAAIHDARELSAH